MDNPILTVLSVWDNPPVHENVDANAIIFSVINLCMLANSD